MLAKFLLLLLVAALASFSSVEAAPAVASLPITSYCAEVLNYTLVFVNNPDNSTCTATSEAFFEASSSSLALVPISCRQAFYQYYCALIFPPVQLTATPYPPPFTKTNIDNACTGFAAAVLDNTINTIIASGAAVPPWSTKPVSNTSIATFKNDVPSRAPRCVSLTGPNAFSSQFCTSGIITSATHPNGVYLPAKTVLLGNPVPQTDYFAHLDFAFSQFNFLFTAAEPKVCLPALARLVCSTIFPSCYTAVPGIPYPSFPEQNLCLEVLHACDSQIVGGFFFAMFNVTLTQANYMTACTQNTTLVSECIPSLGAQPVIQIPVYPATNTTIASALVPPNPIAVVAQPTQVVVTCPAPLVIPDHPNGGAVTYVAGSCALPCPSLLYTQEEYDKSDKLMLGLSGIGFFVALLLLITNIVFRKTRKTLYPMMFTVNVFLISMAVFWTGPVGGPATVHGYFGKMQCLDNAQPSKQGWCVFQALLIIFGALSGVAWWFLQTVDLYFQIGLNSRKWTDNQQRIRDISFYSWAFGYPLIAVIAAGGKNAIGNANNGIPWCFITDTDTSWGVFYAPIAAQAFVGTFFMFYVVWLIYASSRDTGANRKMGWWRIYIRPLIFVFVFLLLWGFVFAYRFYENFNEDDYYAETANYLACLLQTYPKAKANNALDPAHPVNLPDCEALKAYPNRGLWYLIQIVVSGVGLWTFFLYNNGENIVMWWKYLSCQAYNFSKTTDSTTGNGASKKPTSGKSKAPKGKKPESDTSLPQIAASSSSANLPATGAAYVDVVHNQDAVNQPETDE